MANGAEKLALSPIPAIKAEHFPIYNVSEEEAWAACSTGTVIPHQDVVVFKKPSESGAKFDLHLMPDVLENNGKIKLATKSPDGANIHAIAVGNKDVGVSIKKISDNLVGNAPKNDLFHQIFTKAGFTPEQIETLKEKGITRKDALIASEKINQQIPKLVTFGILPCAKHLLTKIADSSRPVTDKDFLEQLQQYKNFAVPFIDGTMRNALTGQSFKYINDIIFYNNKISYAVAGVYSSKEYYYFDIVDKPQFGTDKVTKHYEFYPINFDGSKGGALESTPVNTDLPSLPLNYMVPAGQHEAIFDPSEFVAEITLSGWSINLFPADNQPNCFSCVFSRCQGDSDDYTNIPWLEKVKQLNDNSLTNNLMAALNCGDIRPIMPKEKIKEDDIMVSIFVTNDGHRFPVRTAIVVKVDKGKAMYCWSKMEAGDFVLHHAAVKNSSRAEIVIEIRNGSLVFKDRYPDEIIQQIPKNTPDGKHHIILDTYVRYPINGKYYLGKFVNQYYRAKDWQTLNKYVDYNLMSTMINEHFADK
ncbi:MAG: hypothetical protein JW841_17120 [Deltaproteobacteria bacterium]|nr:hypothetical protein [Deltaproteobacteria bacterium]